MVTHEAQPPFDLTVLGFGSDQVVYQAPSFGIKIAEMSDAGVISDSHVELAGSFEVLPLLVKRPNGYGLDIITQGIPMPNDPTPNQLVVQWGSPYNFDPIRFWRTAETLSHLPSLLNEVPLDIDVLCDIAYRLADRSQQLPQGFEASDVITALRHNLLATPLPDDILDEITMSYENGEPINTRIVSDEFGRSINEWSYFNINALRNINIETEERKRHLKTMVNSRKRTPDEVLLQPYQALVAEIGVNNLTYQPFHEIGLAGDIQQHTLSFLTRLARKGYPEAESTYYAAYLLALGSMKRTQLHSRVPGLIYLHAQEPQNIPGGFDALLGTVVQFAAQRHQLQENRLGHEIYMTIEENLDLVA